MDLRTTVVLLVVGSVMLIVGLFLEASIYSTLSGTNAVVNESVTLTNGTTDNLTYVPIESGSVYLRNASADLVGAGNYSLDLTTGYFIYTLVSNDTIIGTDGYFTYNYYKIADTTTRNNIDELQNNAANAFKLGGVGLIVVAAALIISSLTGFGG